MNPEEFTHEELLENEHTRRHIATVQSFMHQVISELMKRIEMHDQTKLERPEVHELAEARKIRDLSDITYGSDEYKKTIGKHLSKMTAHHYARNRHHPEHWENGTEDMTLIDLMELLVDWKSATLRHNDGCITKSIEINQKRFNISPQLSKIFQNTVDNLGWK